MFLKLKGSISTRSYLLYSLEQKKKFIFNLCKIIWREKSSCNEQGASAIGLVVTVFFMFLIILLPLNLFVQELNFYRLINHKVQMATEMACFDAILHLDANAMSEENLILDGQLFEVFETDLKLRMSRTDALDIELEGLTVALVKDRLPYRLHVKFEYPYKTQFILKGHLTKKVDVELSYELPLNN